MRVAPIFKGARPFPPHPGPAPRPNPQSHAPWELPATTYAFPAALAGRTLEFACHLPGHYAYGMHGTVRVSGR